MSGPRHLSERSVLIRADASPQIGGGHIMRCLSLADELARRGAQVSFACASISQVLAARIEEGGHRLVRVKPVPELLTETPQWDSDILSPRAQHLDAERTLAAAGATDWIVLDHYRLDAAWLNAAGPAQKLVIDDLANRPQPCDILIDQTLGRRKSDYSGLALEGCRVLTGPRYAMLSSAFPSARPCALARRQNASLPRRLLISLGTSDAGGITGGVLEAVMAADVMLDVTVVLGSMAPSLPLVAELAKQNSRLRLHVDSRDMVRLTAEADLAVGAAGTSAWERCCLALPAITLILADNQRLVASRLLAAGAAAVANEISEVTDLLNKLSSDRRAYLSMVAAAGAITEGRGCQMIADQMADCRPSSKASLISVREARAQDSLEAWLWRNDPVTRRASQTQDPIIWEDHQVWWERALTSTDRYLYICENNGQPVAVLRFDQLEADNGCYEVSINMKPEARGLGLGVRALSDACDLFLGKRGPVTLTATIQPNNIASLSIFKKVGFQQHGHVASGFARYVRDTGAGR